MLPCLLMEPQLCRIVLVFFVSEKVEVNHCITHRQALLVQHFELEQIAVMDVAIKIVNVIKVHALMMRLLRGLSYIVRIITYNCHIMQQCEGITWKCFKLCMGFKDQLKIVKADQTHVVSEKLTSVSWVVHNEYMADIFKYMNALSKQLQEETYIKFQSEKASLELDESVHIIFVGTMGLVAVFFSPDCGFDSNWAGPKL